MLSTSDLVNALTDPFVQTGVLAVARALVTRVILRGRPVRRLVGQLTFFLALSILLLYHGIIPYEAGPPGASILQRVFLGSARDHSGRKMTRAWSLISLVRVFLTFELQPREGRLLQDLVVGIIYVGAFLSVVAYVFDAPVGTLIATSGAVAIILGLALQSTLSDLFSGIALNLARSYGIGDWLVLGSGIEGRVVETNWRATHLLTNANDLVVVPNSDLAKARLTNLSSPERSHGVTLGALPADHDAVRHRRGDALGADQQRHDPASARADRSGRVARRQRRRTRAFVPRWRDRGGGQGQERNLRPDLPARQGSRPGAVVAARRPAWRSAAPDADEPQFGQHVTPRRVLDAIALFASLTDGGGAIAERMVRRTFRKGEVLASGGGAQVADDRQKRRGRGDLPR